jgi:hypothetical protein
LEGNEIALSLGKNVSVVELNLSCLKNIKSFINSWDIRIDVLINNTGVQHVHVNRFTCDEFEETIAALKWYMFRLAILLQH